MGVKNKVILACSVDSSKEDRRKSGCDPSFEHCATAVSKIAQTHIPNVSGLVSLPGAARDQFERFVSRLRQNINPSVTEQDAIVMLAQHIITQPVFDALFGDYSFVKNNHVSKCLQEIISVIDKRTDGSDAELLETFCSSVSRRVQGIGSAEAKQKLIAELYEKFFSTAVHKVTARLGIVYTPIEIVDFMIYSVEDVLQSEFGRSLSDEDVHVLDPFTGTGTFITRLLQSPVIRPEDLARKYHREIHANEIGLLAYYVASINIENVYHALIASSAPAESEQMYAPFPGICLTDTFELGDTELGDRVFRDAIVDNSDAAFDRRRNSLRVILGNPPYSVGQKSANDDAQNREYKKLEQRIRETYVAQSDAKNSKAAYDAYIKAFRWASDVLDTHHGGVIAFITNSGWLEANGLDGFRRCVGTEFSSVYVLNLRGAVRGQNGAAARKEGNNVFDIMTGVAITILVKLGKDADKSNIANIYYKDIGDYLSREEKLRFLRAEQRFGNVKQRMDRIYPNAYGDWVNARTDIFVQYFPMEPQKKGDVNAQSIFCTYAIGIATNRDAWVYGFSRKSVETNVRRLSVFFNQQQTIAARAKEANPNFRLEDHLDADPRKISWSRNLKKELTRNVAHRYDDSALRLTVYRPFTKTYLYYDRSFVECPGIWTQLFPSGEQHNMIICVPGLGSIKGYSVLMADCPRDLDTYGGIQCFPLYFYDTDERTSTRSCQFGGQDPRFVRRDGITDFIHIQARNRYGPRVTKEDIFFYVYGVLHSPSYRTTFANDLKKLLPRIPLIDRAADFWAFSNAGRELADLHLNYETRTPPDGVLVNGVPPNRANFADEQLVVRRMAFLKKGRMDTIVYNAHIRVSDIPLSAYEYVVNGKSAIEWVMERYAVRVHKESGIVNDPNCWGAELGNPRYILDLLLSIIRVSVETLDIVGRLPTSALN